ncbi:hypothetical protein GALMADRAFT_144230 [Galerina marginata CBS 339.88]|uniref:Uncharacterized protein n=1 Tax=Galerina marginata (strain CBS 339.88) TaxID=685588 RepID=A0A067SJN4_GALM3|nr:hypothetical protein GALMADRAFT_144230 [Galerina marginata CBS 339.88]
MPSEAFWSTRRIPKRSGRATQPITSRSENGISHINSHQRCWIFTCNHHHLSSSRLTVPSTPQEMFPQRERTRRARCHVASPPSNLRVLHPPQPHLLHPLLPPSSPTPYTPSPSLDLDIDSGLKTSSSAPVLLACADDEQAVMRQLVSLGGVDAESEQQHKYVLLLALVL